MGGAQKKEEGEQSEEGEKGEKGEDEVADGLDSRPYSKAQKYPGNSRGL